MKIQSGILCIYILVLVALPAYQSVAEKRSAETCCSHCSSNSSKDQDDNDKLPARSEDSPFTCNPFEICTACTGFTIQIMPDFTIPVAFSRRKLFVHYPEPASAFSLSVFHPPQIG
jgi:hypothetical protein